MNKIHKTLHNKSIKATGDSPSLFAEIIAPAPYFYRYIQEK
jgi:hypothetical protein